MIQATKVEDYKPANYARGFVGGRPKVGKTTLSETLVEGTRGKVVSDPSRLYVISYDPGGLACLIEHMGAKPYLKGITVFNLEHFANEFSASPDTVLFRATCEVLDKIRGECQTKPGVAAVYITGGNALVTGIHREVRMTTVRQGVDMLKAALDMDQYRWTLYGSMMDIIRAKAHAIRAHVFWEFGVMTWTTAEGEEDSVLIQGKQAGLFTGACEQALQVTFKTGDMKKTRVLNTRPNWNFMETSRMESRLPPTIEPADLSVVIDALGLPMAEKKGSQ